MDYLSMRPRQRTGLSLALAAAAALTSLTGAQPPADDAGVVTGETIPATALGPGFVENEAQMMIRLRRNPVPPRIDIPAPFNRAGVWSIPSDGSADFPHSGSRYITNRFGDDALGIGFPEPTTVHSAWIAGQGGEGAWAEAIRVIGYLDGREIGRTEWFETIGAIPTEMTIDLHGVDRVVFEVRPSSSWGGWFALDDFSYTPKSDADPTVLDFEDRDFRFVLTGSRYRGLHWERGDGRNFGGEGIHPPQDPDTDDNAPAEEDEMPAAAGFEGAAVAPTLGFDFEAIRRGDAGQFSFPPDTSGAVGPDHFVCVVNLNFGVFLKNSGAQVMNISLSSFLPGANGDPRVLYDHFEDRWIVIASNFNNRIYFAYSLTDDPTGPWYKTSILISQGADVGKWPDYPTLGVDANGIYIASFMVSSSMTLLAIDKTPLLTGSPNLGTVTAFRSLTAVGAMQPCETFGDSGGVFIISRLTATALRVRQVVGDLSGSPTLNIHGIVNIVGHNPPPDAAALGSNVAVDTVGTRLMNAVWRDGKIWTAHAIGVGSWSAVRWYEIPTATLNETYGTVFDLEHHFYFPSICTNAQGDMAIGFSGSNSSEYIGAYFTGRRATDPAGQTGAITQYRVGTGPINLIDGFGRNRWGDYSLTTVDPDDDLTFYTIQAYGRSSNTWSTQVARLEVETEPGPDNDFCADAIPIGDGSVPYTTVGAFTDGPEELVACSFNGDQNVDRDVWYLYTASCTGLAEAEICASDFNNRIAVYEGATCPTEGGSSIVACNDDLCGDGTQAKAFFLASAGEQYLIRVGGFNGAFGSGTLTIICTPDTPVCPADIDDDGIVAFSDLLALLSAWGPCPGCPADLNGDDLVGFADLVDLLASWGPC